MRDKYNVSEAQIDPSCGVLDISSGIPTHPREHNADRKEEEK